MFLLCAESLSSLILLAEMEGKILGLPITKGGIQLSHLFFADNSLLFCRATFIERCNIQWVLERYERASSQTINKGKTSIFFCKNTRCEFRDHVSSISGVSST